MITIKPNLYSQPTGGVLAMVASLGLPVDVSSTLAKMAAAEKTYLAGQGQCPNMDGGDDKKMLLDENGVFTIAGVITDDTYKDAKEAVAQGCAAVKINSPGGMAIAGIATYNIFAECDKMPITIDGQAFSAASIIAAAGEPTHLNLGATLGIHRPWAIMIGNAEELRAEANALDVVSKSILDIYKDRVPVQNQAKLIEMYEAETMLSGKEAVELGLADTYTKPRSRRKKKKMDSEPANILQEKIEQSEKTAIDVNDLDTHWEGERDNPDEPDWAWIFS